MATGPYTYDPNVSMPDEDLVNTDRVDRDVVDDQADDPGLTPIDDNATVDDAGGPVPDDGAINSDTGVPAGGEG